MEPDSKRGVVAVAGNDHKSVIDFFVEQIKSVNDQRHIRGVFAGNIVKLLLCFDGKSFQFIFPVFQSFFSPVSVGSFYNNTSISREFLYYSFQFGKLSVVCIDQQSDFFKILHNGLFSCLKFCHKS